jgi:Zn2+/Cd2+-exporting ATPase
MHKHTHHHHHHHHDDCGCEAEHAPAAARLAGADVATLDGDDASCTLSVSGMDCSSCAESVDHALRGLAGVQDVRTDVVGGRVTVRYAEGKLARGDLVGAINRIGYRVQDDTPLRREVFEIQQMDCAVEARQIEDKLGRLPGVSQLQFDLVNRRLTVEGEITAPEIELAISQLGMHARLLSEQRVDVSWWERRGRLVLAIVSGLFWAASLVANYVFDQENLAGGLAVGAIVAGGRYIVPRGIRAARHGALDMNFLMTIAAIGALIIGEYLEAATTMFLFAVAQLLESFSMDRARNAIRGLMDLSPAGATVMRGGAEVRVPVDQVRVGETVVVRPGEKVSVDGEVLRGYSSVNQASITGESIPVDKAPGAEVFAGTLNGEGVLEVRSTKPASDTTLARIIHAVEEAQASRAPSQAFVDRFARVYTPAVVIVSLLLAVLPPLLGFGPWGEWFYRALVLLVVACPCALVISTPVTIVSALTGAARQGILIKGGLHLENAGRARVLAIDKTGTLTEGSPSVAEVLPLGGMPERELMELAAAVEQRSEHPLARAVVRHAAHLGIRSSTAEDITALPGRGVHGRIGGLRVYVGAERLFGDLGTLDPSVAAELERQSGQGRTTMLVGSVPASAGPDVVPTLHGLIAVTDRVRENAAEAMRALHAAGIERIVMLTGDNAGTAQAVAAALGGPGVGVDDFSAELLPEGKVARVKELRDEFGSVLFVGDGVNDAPALAAANVGVAMGSAGTDIALETADIALMADDLSKLSLMMRISRRAESIIRANITFALVTKAVFVVLAVTGYATLWMAVFADMGASLIVVANGLRALHTR